MKKTLTMVLAFALVFALGVGGTLAWLTATSPEVENTFTVGDINITLEETGMDNNRQKHYDYVPGDTLEKDPTVTVLADSEKCYLFIKVVAENNIEVEGGYALNWAIAEGWIPYNPVEGQVVPANGTYYFYREVAATTADTPFTVLADNQVTVSDKLTKDSALETAKFALTFDAAAVQFENIDGLDAAFAQTGF